MWNELRGIVSGIGNSHLRGLLDALLDDDDVARRYRRAPAAKQIHHAYLGGLIEHVLSLCALARATSAHYKHVDADLLLTGVVLHDIGKIYELSYERGFSYSPEGQLLGHIQIALRMIGDKLRGLPEFPPRLRSLVEHMVLSHHGQLEFGSPKVPQFPEALLLHYLDDMDSKMECMRALIANDRQPEGCFTTYSSALERTALKMDRYLNPAPPAPRPPVRPNGIQAAPAGPVSPPVGQSLESAPPAETTPRAVDSPRVEEAETVAAPTASPAQAAHPLFAPKSDSLFADKLRQALLPAAAKQEN
jgi:3'-5' exoribonuclease